MNAQSMRNNSVLRSLVLGGTLARRALRAEIRSAVAEGIRDARDESAARPAEKQPGRLRYLLLGTAIGYLTATGRATTGARAATEFVERAAERVPTDARLSEVGEELANEMTAIEAVSVDEPESADGERRWLRRGLLLAGTAAVLWYAVGRAGSGEEQATFDEYETGDRADEREIEIEDGSEAEGETEESTD